MAKCVEDVTTKEIRRVSNELAEELVASGTYRYTTKGAWKRSKAPEPKSTNNKTRQKRKYPAA